MIVEICAFLVVFLTCWYLNFRPRSTNQLKPPYRSCTTPQEVALCDYVVVGGGAAGLAAAAALLHHTPDNAQVVLVEAGPDGQPTSTLALLLSSGRRDRLLSFAPDQVDLSARRLPPGAHPTFLGLPTPDMGHAAQRPFRFSAEEEAKRTENGFVNCEGPAAAADMEMKFIRYEQAQYTAYPRGRGVGGTALLDWGIHLNSIWPASKTASHKDGSRSSNSSTSTTTTSLWARLPAHFPAIRNPFSWAFAETVKASGLVPPHLPTVDSPVLRGTVFPAYLYLDKDGRRLALPSAVFADFAPDVLARRLRVLAGYEVLDLEVTDNNEPRRVTGVCVRRTGAAVTQAVHTIQVSKGVVIAAGALQTPQLLYDACFQPQKVTLPRPLPTACAVRDVLALPLIFPAMPALSADAFNARDAKSSASWWLTQRGPFLAPLADTIASVKLPKFGPDAELRIVLLPFGGRDAARFAAMGWDTILATPLQAYTMLVVLQGIDGLEHSLSLTAATPNGGKSVAKRQRRLCERSASPTLPAELQRRVQDALMEGMRMCRRLSKENPLASLTLDPGAESVDFTLLVPSDEASAVRLTKLSRQMPSKLTARNKVDLRELMRWSRTVTGTEAYMRGYVDAHAYWLGFASGTSEPFLAGRSGADAGVFTTRVEGLANVVVGDNSAVTAAQWAGEGRRDSLAAGSRSCTMHVAEKAVAELLEKK